MYYCCMSLISSNVKKIRIARFDVYTKLIFVQNQATSCNYLSQFKSSTQLNATIMYVIGRFLHCSYNLCHTLCNEKKESEKKNKASFWSTPSREYYLHVASYKAIKPCEYYYLDSFNVEILYSNRIQIYLSKAISSP